MALTKAMGVANKAGGGALMGAAQALGLTGLAADVMSALGLSRADPEIGYSYFVEIDGIGCVRFKEASGFKMTTKVSKVREGGNNVFEHAMIDSQTFEPLTIKKGYYSQDDEFWSWMKDMHDPATPIERKTISLVILNDMGTEVCRFNLFGAFIMEYEGPSFDAQGKDIVFESVKINYDYFQIEKADLLDVIMGNALASGLGAIANSL